MAAINTITGLTKGDLMKCYQESGSARLNTPKQKKVEDTMIWLEEQLTTLGLKTLENKTPYKKMIELITKDHLKMMKTPRKEKKFFLALASWEAMPLDIPVVL